MFWVDRTGFIPLLEALKAKAVVSLRNRRMGKTLWIDTLAHYYDVAHKGRFKELFGHLEIGKAPTQLANTFHVLPLTFAGIKSHNFDDFRRSLNAALNQAAADFKERYNLSFELNDRDAAITFQGLVDELKRKNEKLYVLIDEYDVSINKALGDLPLVSEKGLLKSMENTYAEFFSRIKTACDRNVARCFVTGVTPLALNEFTSGFNIAEHITRDRRFASLYGFTEADVRNGLARLHRLQPEVVDRIVDSWRRDHNGYHFHPRQEVALYNPTRVLSFDPPLSTLRPEEAADFLLNEIQSDPNSMPAEATLEAIKSSPYASLVVAEALSSDDAELECAGGVANQFRLSHMHELNTGRTPLLSFMFYTGALTYARSPPKLKHSLRIPNNVARKEFTVELQRLLDIDEIGVQQLRGAIVKMVDGRQVEPFCRAVSRFLLRGLDGRDALGGEDPFAQAVYDAMLLARRPGDCVRKEYKVDPVARHSNTSGPALDVVYIGQQAVAPQKPQHYCFTLKNVKVQGLVLGQGVQSWEKQVEISRTIDNMGGDDEAVLDLPLAKGDNFRKPGSTVRTVLEEAIQEARGKYVPALQAEVGEANVHCWALVRVGMTRIVCKKVLPVEQQQ
ncbi:uncharacterized protein ACA1_378620 [Acanthamoeba castellanii str. Neff]|uniref:AAA-ATPase-like domain-containing protein n=1 Tax=Acanthamoeba castellanii (strain ATCC 30010 / Neff) TaxID=1257118 RepID=L8GS16_ACACF|nr:uncharacterized protein ACA1_378620 [Acanthamoeba castellanii str. Neff]ELR15712.1 hypothetical protein ACA1_378620 [Acanthamoeba castellanii str. Neff]